MGTKRENIENPQSCLSKAADDEPIFVLRAKDPLAADIVREWAMLAARDQVHEEEKCRAALECAQKMDEWRFFHSAPARQAST